MGLGLLVAAGYLQTQSIALAMLEVVANAVGQGGGAQGQPAEGLYVALATCATTPITVGLVWLFARLRRGISVIEYLALKPLSWGATARWCGALMGLVILSDGLTTVLHRPLVPEVMVQMYRSAGFVPLLWLAVVVAAPLGEETFFRGFVFKGILHSRLGGTGAVVLTALVWAVMHQQYDLYGVANVFAAGLLLGYARLRTNSIYPGLLMHAVMNLIATIEVAVVIRLSGGSN
jgi:membrane protease YdiL (CAAX protease family)